MRIFKYLATVLLSTLLIVGTASVFVYITDEEARDILGNQILGANPRVLVETQGGTGTSTPSGILYGNSGNIETVTIGTNLTFSGGILSSTGGGGSDPFTHTTNFGQSVSATTTPIWFQNGLSASSTSNFDNVSSTLFSASGNSWLSTISLSGDITPTTNNTLNLGAYGSALANIFSSSTVFASTTILARGTSADASIQSVSSASTGVYFPGVTTLGLTASASVINWDASNFYPASGGKGLGRVNNSWGQLHVSSTSQFGATTTISNSNGGTNLVIDTKGSSSGEVGTIIGKSSTDAVRGGYMYRVSDSSNRIYNYTTGPINFYINSVEKMRVASTGFLGIATTSPATALDVNGTITQLTVKSCSLGLTTDALGSITGCVSSDIKLKKNISPLLDSISTLLKLNPITYQWKDTTKDTMVHSGFIAQDVEKVLPSAVPSAGEGIKGVDPNSVLSLVIKSFQDLYKEFISTTQMLFSWNAEQDKKIVELQQQINNLQKQINSLK